MEDNGNDFEMLKRAVAFSQANLDELREGDILNFKEDLWDLTGRGNTLDETRDDFVRRLSLDQLKNIQAQFKRAFTALADGQEGFSWKIERQPMIFATHSESSSEPFGYSVYSLDQTEMAEISLSMVLVRSRAIPEQFRRCPECRAVFFLGRKPDKRSFYCSQRCAVRVAVRSSRKRQLARERKKAKGKNR